MVRYCAELHFLLNIKMEYTTANDACFSTPTGTPNKVPPSDVREHTANLKTSRPGGAKRKILFLSQTESPSQKSAPLFEDDTTDALTESPVLPIMANCSPVDHGNFWRVIQEDEYEVEHEDRDKDEDNQENSIKSEMVACDTESLCDTVGFTEESDEAVDEQSDESSYKVVDESSDDEGGEDDNDEVASTDKGEKKRKAYHTTGEITCLACNKTYDGFAQCCDQMTPVVRE
jgi:hypothetical protein